ncbi:lanthionine synthetase LanC family protein [Arachidicoccus soli]|uniref:Lanthionine synthetase C-like protein n=1 Tax=Arachidicoccus soli TaxID=2341117 RepID=A0A386HTB4_9BACT|nr:lanthionine synthetase LanC family protein [Arachidicoccus soli]AYD49053.1 hypothetical protein D6B99_16380 [Arachidicoccus soli]
MEKLRRIANIITLDAFNLPDIGLFKGRMGVILFYFNYGRYTGNKLYFNIASELLTSVYKEVQYSNDISFEEGVAGVVWGMRYLINNNFIDGNPTEMFGEFERILSNGNFNDCDYRKPMSKIGMYLHLIIENEDDGYLLVKDLIYVGLKKFEFYFLCLSLPKPITYINSVLLFLLSLEKIQDFKIECERILFKICLSLSRIGSWAQFEKYDLRILYKLLIAIKFSSQEKETILKEINSIIIFNYNGFSSKDLWQNFFFLPQEEIVYNFEDINRYIDQNYSYRNIVTGNISIYRGLAGIGLALMNNGG